MPFLWGGFFVPAPPKGHPIMKLLSKREASDRLGLSVRTLEHILARDATLPRVRIGRLVKIPEDGLNGWVASQYAPAEPPAEAPPEAA
jgi:excisionase family DNA binding protein